VGEEVTEGSSDDADCDIQRSASESSPSKKSLRRISSGRTNWRGSAKSINTSDEEHQGDTDDALDSPPEISAMSRRCVLMTDVDNC
jgi:hypothetical protein